MTTAAGLRAGRAYVELGVDNNQLSAGLRAASGQLRAFGSSLQAVGMNMMKVGGAIALPMIGAITTFASFEKQMARVKAISNSTPEEFARLTAEAKRLGEVTEYSASQAAAMMTEFATRGYKVNDMLAAAGPALQMATAGQLELAEAAGIAGDIMGGMRIQAKDLGEVTDKLTYAFSNSATDLRQLGEAFKYVGPSASDMGFSLDEVSSALMVLANNGQKADMAGTTLRGIFETLKDPPSEARKELEKLGVVLDNGRGKFRKLDAIIGDMQQGLSKLSKVDKAAAISRIFTNRQTTGTSILVGENDKGVANVDVMRDFQTRLDTEAGGTGNRVQATMLDTLWGSWKLIESAIEGVAITIGETLMPTLREMGSVLSTNIGIFHDFIKANKEWLPVAFKAALAIGGVGAALVATGLGFAGLGVVMGGLASGVAGIGAVLGSIALAAGGGAAAILTLSSGVGETVAGFATLENAGLVMQEVFSLAALSVVSAAFTLQGIAEAARMAAGTVFSLIPPLGSLADLATTLKGSLGVVAISVGVIGGGMIALAVVSKVAAVAMAAYGAVVGAVTLVTTAASVATGLLTGAIGVIGGVLGLLVSPVGLVVIGVGAAAAAFLTMTESGRGLVSFLGSGLSDALSSVAKIATDMGSTFSQAWGGIVDAISSGNLEVAAKIAWKGMQVIWQKGVNWISSVWTGFSNFFVDVFAEAGGMLVKGINLVWAGLELMWFDSFTAVGSAWGTMLDGMLKAYHHFVYQSQLAWIAWQNSVGAMSNHNRTLQETIAYSGDAGSADPEKRKGYRQRIVEIVKNREKVDAESQKGRQDIVKRKEGVDMGVDDDLDRGRRARLAESLKADAEGSKKLADAEAELADALTLVERIKRAKSGKWFGNYDSWFGDFEDKAPTKKDLDTVGERATGMGAGGGSAGTFDANMLRFLAGTGNEDILQKRQAEAAEKAAERLQRLIDIARDNNNTYT